MAKLKNWTITQEYNDKYYLHGIVYGHRDKIRCSNGTSIHTTHVCTAVAKDEEITVKTRNTTYHLAYADMAKDSFYVNNISEFLDSFALDKAKQALELIIKNREKLKSTHINNIAGTLEPNCLYFEINPEYDDFALFKNSNSDITKIEPELICEVMYATPYYSLKSNDSEIDVRYFYDSFSNILYFFNSAYSLIQKEKLSDPQGTFLGYISNQNIAPLKVIFSWGKQVTVKPFEAIQVVYGMGRKCRSRSDFDTHDFVNFD